MNFHGVPGMWGIKSSNFGWTLNHHTWSWGWQTPGQSQQKSTIKTSSGLQILLDWPSLSEKLETWLINRFVFYKSTFYAKMLFWTLARRLQTDIDNLVPIAMLRFTSHNWSIKSRKKSQKSLEIPWKSPPNYFLEPFKVHSESCWPFLPFKAAKSLIYGPS